MITLPGALILLVGVAVVLLGRLFGVLELYVIGAGLVALVVWCFLLVHLGRVRLRVARRVQPSRVHVDEPARVELAVRNTGWRTTPVLKLTDPVSSTPGASLSVSPIRPGTGSRAAYRLPTTRRGKLRVGPMSLERRDPFGLARRTVRAAGIAEITVYPAYQHLPFPGRGAGRGPLAEHLRMRALARQGEEFHALRNYQPGDDLRRVHWKQSARSDDLKIKENDTNTARRLGVVLDVEPAHHTAASFERAVSAAASFVVSAAEAGYLVRAALSSSSTGDTVDIDAYLEELALVQPTAGRDLLDAVADVGRWLDGGALVVATGVAHPEAYAAARAAQPAADAGVLVVCEAPVTPSSGSPFVIDGSSPAALQAGWERLMGPAGTPSAVAGALR